MATSTASSFRLTGAGIALALAAAVSTPAPGQAQEGGFRAVGPGSPIFVESTGGATWVVQPPPQQGVVTYGSAQPPLVPRFVRTPGSQDWIESIQAHDRARLHTSQRGRARLRGGGFKLGEAARERLREMRSYRNGDLITPEGILPAGHPASRLSGEEAEEDAGGAAAPEETGAPPAEGTGVISRGRRGTGESSGPTRTPGGIVGIGGR